MLEAFPTKPSLLDEISQGSNKHNHELTQLFADADHIYFGDDLITFRFNRLTKQWIRFENVEWDEFTGHPHCYVPRRWAKDEYVRNYTNPIFIIRTFHVKLRCAFEKKRSRLGVRVVEHRVKAVDDKPTMPNGKVLTIRINVEASDAHWSRAFVVNNRLGYVFLQRYRSSKNMEFDKEEPLHIFEISRKESEQDQDGDIYEWKSYRIVSTRWKKKGNLFFDSDSTQMFLHNRRIYCVNLMDVEEILYLDLCSGKFYYVLFVRSDPLHGLPNSKHFHSSPSIFQSDVYFYSLSKFDTDSEKRQTITGLWKLSLDDRFQWKFVLHMDSSDVSATIFHEDGSIRLFPRLPECVNPVTNNAYCREDSLQSRLVMPTLERFATEALLKAFPRLFYGTDFEARLSEPIDLILAVSHLSKCNEWQIFCWWVK